MDITIRRGSAWTAALLAALAAPAFAQSTASQLHGHWSLVSIEDIAPDGRRTPNPLSKGLFTYDPNGRYTVQIFRPDLPRFAAGIRSRGTDEENRAVVAGSLSHFGTFKVNEAEGTITVFPEASSFPNWTGVVQPARKCRIEGDTLTITNPAPSNSAGTTLLTLKRMRPLGMGTWALNLEKSRFAPGMAPKSALVTFDPAGEAVKFTGQFHNADDSRVNASYQGLHDGRDIPYVGSRLADTTSVTRIDPYTTLRIDKKEGKAVMEMTREVAIDDRSFIVTVKGRNAKGEAYENLWAFERR